MNTSVSPKQQSVRTIIACLPLAALLLVAPPAQADWPDTNATKFVQLPDITPNGMDIFFGNSPTLLADDFVCTNTGPVSDIHLWLSSIENVPTTAGGFELSIWSDVPFDPAAGQPSHPGQRLWAETFAPGQYQVALAATNLQEQFWNLEATPPQSMGTDTRLFLYNFYPKQPFIQQGSAAAPAIYWLGVSMQNNVPPQGWKTSTNRLAPDDAILGHYKAGTTTLNDWKELRDPRVPNGASLNFAFALTTTNPPPQQTPCPETNGVKFLQRPNIDGGLDVLASQGLALADDFLCTNSGPVTDIHIWGSWLQNGVDLNIPIWLGIYSDVPAVPGASPSHPGNLLWQQWFGPGQYSETLWANGQEQFYDPSKPAILGPDTQAYYLCFFPTNPFVQKGTASAPTIYWLSVYAQTTPTAGPLFGWKTSLDHFQDDAAWVAWPGGPPTGGWRELVDLTGKSLDLAFKLTTPTNPCGPVPIVCPVTKVVECGSTWAFDLPTFPANTCCGTNVTISVVNTVTNGACPQFITRIWQIVDCSGNQSFCSQAVKVQDTLPPTLLCGTDKNIPCGVPWSFDVPTVSDRCCKDVTVSLVSTVTNGICPQVITRTWQATDCCNNAATCSQTITVQCCPTVSTNKWVQYPDLSTNGLDVLASQAAGALAKILADDFLCTNAGPITNIQIWGSWLDDALDPTAQIMLAIWTDVPAPVTGGYSHPGQLLWSNWFGPSDYKVTAAATANENFYNPNLPGTSGIIGPDHQVWLYTFNPKQPFCQKGSLNSPVVYWLSVTARKANGLFGWKTSTNHFKDDAVFGHVGTAGVPLADWKDLHDPRPTMNNLSLDLAFRLDSGPATVDCDPNMKPKFVQWPDPSTNGMDVRATAPKILADDFLCRIPGQINGITVWGSWLKDAVDTNARFQLGLWTDVPVSATNKFSHPGQLLCLDLFYPPQTTGTSLLRYKYRLDAANLLENFFDPDLPFPPFVGNDTQIWRYDFYPFVPSCWLQKGQPFKPVTYWLSVSALTDTNKYLFGWKTSTNHWQDDGVYGHLSTTNTPLRDWTDLHDPRPPGKSLDLSFALRTFPVIGINKDLKNTTPVAANGIQIVVAGIHDITWHYDDGIVAWPDFQVSYVGGNTILAWFDSSGITKRVLPGAISHVGFEMTGSSLTIVSMAWLSGGSVIGPIIQVGHHMLANGGTLVIENNIVHAPVLFAGGTVEVFSDTPPGLDQMIVGGLRNPMATFPLPGQWPMLIPDGGTHMITLPPSLIPPGAQYLLFITGIDPAMSGARAARRTKGPGDSATTDFILLPLDTALRPVIETIDNSTGNVTLTWTSVVGRTYRLQSQANIGSSAWTDLNDVVAEDVETGMTVPVGGNQAFYRVTLLPE